MYHALSWNMILFPRKNLNDFIYFIERCKKYSRSSRTLKKLSHASFFIRSTLPKKNSYARWELLNIFMFFYIYLIFLFFYFIMYLSLLHFATHILTLTIIKMTQSHYRNNRPVDLFGNITFRITYIFTLILTIYISNFTARLMMMNSFVMLLKLLIL